MRSVSQPEQMVPTTSKTPTSASRLAAVVIGIPWSCAAGMKCVPTRPLVEAPQIAKPPTSNQNAGRWEANRSAPRAARAGEPAAGGGGTGAVAPYGSSPRSLGRSRSSRSTSGTTASATAETVSEAARQPWCSTSTDRTGRKTSWPVALPAVSTPVTRPRRVVNQRLAIVAANTSAIEPVPRPTSTPHRATSCQPAVMTVVSPLPLAMSTSAQLTTRLMPYRSMSAAANGAVSPKSTRLIDTASETVSREKPSASSGTSSTPGVERNPAAPTRVRKATAATPQARCGRVRRRPSRLMRSGRPGRCWTRWPRACRRRCARRPPRSSPCAPAAAPSRAR